MKKIKNKTFIDSVKHATDGLIEAFKSEKNFKVYTRIAMVFGLLNIIFKIKMHWWIGYILAVCGVFGTELINTAIEKLCDIVTLDIREDIKQVKDISASGVLFWGFGFFLIEALAIICK